ncbi:MAG: tetratricopeptide repeat protein [Marinicellaceae bacterium]
MRVSVFLILWLTTFVVNALDLDRETINVAYLELPSNPIVNPADRSYSIFYNSQYNALELQRVLDSLFHINGFIKLDTNATISVDFQFDEVKVTETEVLSKKRKIKNKNNDKKNQYEYHYIPVLRYETYAKVIVNYANGDTKVHKFGKKNNKYEGPKTYSTSEANIALTSNLYQILFEIQSDFVADTATKMNKKLNELHGYLAINTTDYLLILDSRLVPEYKDYKRYYQLTSRLFKQMTPFDSTDGIKAAIQPVLTFLKGIPEKYTRDKKADKKMRYASYYNLAKIYLYLDEYEKSIDYYEKVIENDYREGQSKRNIKDIDKIKDLLAINQVNTRHFNIQLQNQSFENNVQSNSQEVGFQYLDAEITTNKNESLEGKIELTDDIDDVIYELQNISRITFKFLNESNEIAQKQLLTSTINAIQLLDLKLQRVNYHAQQQNSNKPVNTGKVDAGLLTSVLAIEVFTSNKVSLYNFNGELILKKPAQENGISTASTAFSFAFKKKLGEYFSECQSMQPSIKSGEFKNNTQGLIQAAEVYSQCMP